MKKIIFIVLGVVLTVLLTYGIISQKESSQIDKLRTKIPGQEDDHQKETPKPKIVLPQPDSDINSLVQLLAAVDIESDEYKNQQNSEIVKKHYQEFNQNWTNLENKRLEPIRVWRDNELQALNTATHNLFYPFSGPDFLNANEIFPNCDNYLLFGLEKIGELPSWESLKGAGMQNYLYGVRTALSEIFQRNYFITMRMNSALNSQVKGVLPILSVFLARTGNDIVKIEKIVIRKNGEAVYSKWDGRKDDGFINGICIEFVHEKAEKSQKLYYFSTDLGDHAMASKGELVTFIKSFASKISLVKSASYLLHTANFNTVKNLILDETEACVQDDTGVPYKYFKQKNWDVRLYGKYARPIRDFNHGYQPDLAKVFEEDKSIKPINFTFGYHWWTDKSSILYCTKK